MMVGTKRAEEVVDPNLEVKPTTRALKRALLVALRCVDPESEKRPKMSQVVRMLEADEYPLREVKINSHPGMIIFIHLFDYLYLGFETSFEFFQTCALEVSPAIKFIWA
jgi:hypothetical protein